MYRKQVESSYQLWLRVTKLVASVLLSLLFSHFNTSHLSFVLCRFTEGLDDHLAILEQTLIASHLAPTAPDTVGCYPYADKDPFIIDQCPHIMFSGNSPTFGSKIFRSAADKGDGMSVLLLTVPCFATTKSFVSVNLRTMECRQFHVEASFGDTTNDLIDAC